METIPLERKETRETNRTALAIIAQRLDGRDRRIREAEEEARRRRAMYD